MKRLIILMIAVLPFMAKGQVTIDSTFGGQLQARVYGKVVTPSNDSVRIESQYSFNTQFVPVFSDLIVNYKNTGATADTLSVSDTISISVPGSYYVRISRISFVSGDTLYSPSVPVTVTPVIVAPSISFPQTSFPSASGGQQIYDYNAGNAVATVEVWVSPGDTNFATPFLTNTLSLTGSGQKTFTFGGYPAQYYFSYKFVVKNSAGNDTTLKGWILTLPSGGNPWISNLVSSSTTIDSVYTNFNLVTSGTNTIATTHIALSSNASTPLQSVVRNITGQPGITQLAVAFGGLSQSTSYVVWTCITAGSFSACSQKSTVITATAPTLLSFSILSAQTTSSVNQKFNTSSTSAADGVMWLEVANASDPGFTSPVYASGTQSFLMGITNHGFNASVLSNGQGFTAGNTYLAKLKGYNQNGEFKESSVVSFIFQPIFTAINEINDYSKWFVFDNQLTIKSDYAGEVLIFDTSGRIVRRFVKSEFELNQYLDLNPGIYLLNYGTKSQKFLIK